MGLKESLKFWSASDVFAGSRRRAQIDEFARSEVGGWDFGRGRGRNGGLVNFASDSMENFHITAEKFAESRRRWRELDERALRIAAFEVLNAGKSPLRFQLQSNAVAELNFGIGAPALTGFACGLCAPDRQAKPRDFAAGRDSTTNEIAAPRHQSAAPA